MKFTLALERVSYIDVPNSHWLVDENRDNRGATACLALFCNRFHDDRWFFPVTGPNLFLPAKDIIGERVCNYILYPLVT